MSGPHPSEAPRVAPRLARRSSVNPFSLVISSSLVGFDLCVLVSFEKGLPVRPVVGVLPAALGPVPTGLLVSLGGALVSLSRAMDISEPTCTRVVSMLLFLCSTPYQHCVVEGEEKHAWCCDGFVCVCVYVCVCARVQPFLRFRSTHTHPRTPVHRHARSLAFPLPLVARHAHAPSLPPHLL